MATRTLTGRYACGYTLSSAYFGLKIKESAYVGGLGVVADHKAKITNAGTVAAGSGAYGGYAGNIGVNMEFGSVLKNTGGIAGGAGGDGRGGPKYKPQIGGGGGDGVLIVGSRGAVDVRNGGVIRAGSGGAGGASVSKLTAAAIGGVGGVGIDIGASGNDAATLINTGFVYGGVGGAGGANVGGFAAAVGGTGGTGVLLTTHGTVSNTGGHINGGAGGTGGYQGGGGGVAIYMNGGTANVGGASVVSGGAGGGGVRGGDGLGGYGGVGGAGIVLVGGATLFQSGGSISGGDGGVGEASSSYSVPDGAGGAGARLSGGRLVQSAGTITGGAGGNSVGPSAYYVNGGDGVELLSGASLFSGGVIHGGTGGASQSGHGGEGGEGVFLGGGAVINAGSIYGGSGGPGLSGQGPAGIGVDITYGRITNGSATNHSALIAGDYGVKILGGPSPAATVTNFGTIEGASLSVFFSEYFGSTAGDRLVVEQGAVFVGVAYGGNSGGFGSYPGATMELASGADTVTGLGGAATLSGGASASFRGFGNYIVDAAASLTLTGSDSLVSGQTLSGGGTVTIASGSTLTGQGGANAIKLGAGAVVNDGLLDSVAGGLTINGAVTGTGAAQIDGGALAFGEAFAQNVAFSSGVSATLSLAQSKGYTGTITGFSATGADKLDLGDVPFAGATVTFTPNAGNPTGGGVLTVKEGANTATIKLAGNYTTTTFQLADDGHGGVLVTDKAAAAGFASAMAAFAPATGSPPAHEARFTSAPHTLIATPRP